MDIIIIIIILLLLLLLRWAVLLIDPNLDRIAQHMATLQGVCRFTIDIFLTLKLKDFLRTKYKGHAIFIQAQINHLYTPISKP